MADHIPCDLIVKRLYPLGLPGHLYPNDVAYLRGPQSLFHVKMIHHVKVSFERQPNGDSEHASPHPANYHSPYNKLTSIISDLNNRSEDYCIVIQVTKAQSFTDNNQFRKQLDSLIRQLTKRELEIFDLAVNGLSNRLIADKLFITVETVRSHRKNIVSKAGASSVEEIKTWILKTKI